ncbi:thioredoxin family protein [candidate division WOR-3 bacterium]|nr:thioredoxin family protein [candidate division WOR-3 bacterium]
MKVFVKILTVALLAGFISLAFIFGKNNAPLKTTENQSEDSSSVARDSLEENLPRLIEYGSLSCVPCKMLVPELDRMRSECAGKLIVLFVDVYQNPQEANSRSIRVIPTQVFLSERGEELFRHQGFFSADEMLKKWKELGYDFTIDR